MNNEEFATEITNEKQLTVPYILHESEMARVERQLKRLWIVLIVAIALLAITNIAWLYYESQFETISYQQDGEGLNNINTGTQGDVYGSDGENQKEEIWQDRQSAGTRG